ncbi:hypothetical protein BO94DRAFT_580460 [Aspergillus sclerotioniger CBS 115572]|uniref:Rhodopsin domain-containing protein n=1 Tax=Aspergillus sclerotioniger CBS 115572 TaxID=1450535 RepID=A0A317XEK5_9EURO|nr:hypothetical protein BO94DRAFT_580460 [Aspergillus sclerotioniger CBS 115572]PWY96631.1 hypothetical protein BO94DRAFT_580460 [Aspergillus sclerotioniger CBS 115572]
MVGLSANGIKLLIWIVVFTVLTTLVLALRFWAIRLKRRSLKLHDYLVLLAYISTCCMAGLTWWAIANGLGAHTEDLSTYERGVQFQLIVGSSVTWLVGTVACKLSMISLYNTLFPSRRFTWAIWAVTVLVIAYFIAFICIFLTQCHPVSYGWHPVEGGSCRSLFIQEILSITLNMVIDTLIAVLPIPALWRLKMAIRNKITISVMFAMGLIVVAVMAFRLEITLNPATNADFVQGLYLVGLVSFLELWLSIIVVSLPTLAPLFRMYVEPVLVRVLGSKGTGSNQPRRLREAQHTIGSDPPSRRKYAMQDSFLEEGYEFGMVGPETRVKVCGEGGAGENSQDSLAELVGKGISVRHDIQIEREG